MAEAVHLPKIGMIMEDAVLTRWLVPDGATISRGDSIFEMDIEKVLQDVEADAEGTLRYLVGDCIRLRPGAIVACVLAEDELEVPAQMLAEVAAQWSEPSEEHREAGTEPVVPSVVAVAGAAAAAPRRCTGHATTSHATTGHATTGGSGRRGRRPRRGQPLRSTPRRPAGRRPR